MQEEMGRELTMREKHMDFGGSVLGRNYHVFETYAGLDNHKDYIYENDEEMTERFRRYEQLEWEEKMKKKYQLDEKLNNEGLESVLKDILD
jgi:hypothetical protein